MSIANKAGKGFFHFLFRNIIGRGIGMVSMIFLARILTPYEFGLVSISEVLLNIIAMLATTGIGEYLLAFKEEGKEKEIFQSVFWLNLFLSTLVSIVAIVALPFWTAANSDSRILNLGYLVVATFFLNQLHVVPKSWMSRKLEFAKQVKIQTAFIILIPIGKVAAAFMGFGVFSLVIPTLVLLPIEVFLMYRFSGFFPGLNLFSNHWKRVLNFTKNLIGSSILGIFTDQGDKIILARFVSLESLGAYNLAWQLANFFISNVISITNGVLSAVLPKLAHDIDHLRASYFNFLKVIIFSIGFLIVLMGVLGSDLIELMYGPNWVVAGVPLQILCVFAFYRALTSSYGSVMNTLHLTHKALIVNTVYTPFHIIGSLIGAQFGVIGIAASVTSVRFIFIHWGIKQTMNALNKGFIFFYKQLASWFILLMAIVFIGLLLSAAMQNWIVLYRIIAITCILSLLYLVAARLFLKQEIGIVNDFLYKLNPKVGLLFQRLFFI
jgi:PST family polysaccharide transporter